MFQSLCVLNYLLLTFVLHSWYCSSKLKSSLKVIKRESAFSVSIVISVFFEYGSILTDLSSGFWTFWSVCSNSILLPCSSGDKIAPKILKIQFIFEKLFYLEYTWYQSILTNVSKLPGWASSLSIFLSEWWLGWGGGSPTTSSVSVPKNAPSFVFWLFGVNKLFPPSEETLLLQ